MVSAIFAVNILAVIITVILVALLIFLLGFSLKYIKDLTYKIGLIMKAAKQREENPDVLFEDHNGEPIENNGPSVEEVEEILNRMIMQSRSSSFCKIFCFIMDRYNSLLVWPCNCR